MNLKANLSIRRQSSGSVVMDFQCSFKQSAFNLAEVTPHVCVLCDCNFVFKALPGEAFLIKIVETT